MVTCSLKGGAGERRPNSSAPSSSGVLDASNHPTGQAEVICRSDDEEKHNGTSSNSLDDSLPMELCPTIHPVHNLKLDHHDHPETVSVTLYVKNIAKESLRVDFGETCISVTFRTSDPGFLKQYPTFGAEDDLMQWQIETRGTIVPEKCTFRLKPTNLELKLIKAVTSKWESLEATVDSSSTGPSIQKETWISLAPPKAAKPSPASRKKFEEDASQETNSIPLSPSADSVVSFKAGYTGLGNLGNTCYMNAVLQALANTTPLKNYFLDKKFQADINRDNPLGFGGSLAIAFAIILRQLWSGQRDSIEPSHLKSLLANRASQFSGYAQHDAQEFMAFLLDGLHEDLNRVKTKPLTTPVESNGRPDHIVADEAWQVYKMRNDSVIDDLFQGQFKSTLVCPACQNISVTFDPFLYLALPLPPSKSCFTVTVYFDGVDESVELTGTKRGAVKVSLWLDPSQRVQQLKEELKRVCAGRFRLPDSEIELVQVRDGLIRRWLVDAAPLSSLQNTNHSDALLLAFETAPSDNGSLVHIAVIQRVLMPLDEHTHCTACKKESDVLKRCMKCYSVAYCDKNCQRTHWTAVHRTMCRPKPDIIAQPFVVSLPPSSLTYQKLYRSMLYYSRFSVEVDCPPSANNSCNQDMDSSSSSSSSSSSPQEEGEVDGLQQSKQEQPKEYPLFFIKPIDSQGQGIEKKKRLEDLGDKPLDFDADESPIFLSLDWRNDERSPNHCSVTVKSPTDYEDLSQENSDPSADGDTSPNQRRLTLHHCLQQFMQSEVLSKEEAWYCPKCKEHREATKQMSVWRLPEILTIQLKRFSFRNLMWRDKIDQKVHFPVEQLDLSPYLSSITEHGAVYDLYAVVNHYGGILYGHYTSFARCPAATSDKSQKDVVGWRCMDDRQVRDICDESVVTSAAYLLLYRRRRGSSGSSASPVQLNYSDPEEID
ncbi:ubiquitin carboxyl-terminal hydrolase 19-like [Daphnia pulex]|uniref:ubiquitin carboxyl-terminal hydrolase 19-like n=1 Tax=Daphnia pulex TaxID=6669 RepID=UPI001EDE036F|nr:ubiquitin carboxyl-terminal hydrolase 19-like [Daphnia pulex]XP_046440467.1 ubiquitin carboxyl-terminal hydrolase 19-like [Daphnia pulex]XP_046440468.1 ubiquitin carboxyl-terminal hydrolase 19-like [Daphnia pulex]XP_046440469.1 ubiquitin carboxyl-terminal hydrolase 19-like [Daphnia pulex]XP_046440470.1 ubiquitin carboxyl-terminal hydrolase 19-like [Daphnia pulex]XP_046440471.1 ubiquitin carboxyl-terminal hydrolase 19-like [Daphnia pulex]XP_046440472.1 ubiquitin carboxyl-terminal hydrolase 